MVLTGNETSCGQARFQEALERTLSSKGPGRPNFWACGPLISGQGATEQRAPRFWATVD